VRVLFLTRYTATGPSSRYRVVQFLPFLDDAGVAWEVHPLVDDRYLAARFAGGRPGAGYLLARAMRRVGTLLGSGRFDVVFVQKELFPGMPPLAEWFMARGKTPVILDVDDAIHLPYRGRFLLDDKIPRVMRAASAVLAGNRWLAAYAGQHNPNSRYFPTVVDTDRFTPASAGGPERDPVVGWMGSPETVGYLGAVADALREAAARRSFVLRVVGASSVPLNGVRVETAPWTFEDEAAALRGFDVGIMPLPDDEWALGKCSLKLLQYMSAGLATVSSPRGSVADIVDDPANGRVADSPSAWSDALVALLADAELRGRMGRAARETVARDYSLAGWGPRFVAVLRAVAEGRPVGDA
jgi:glycosyltransferase involved in cell wall biosynthesis